MLRAGRARPQQHGDRRDAGAEPADREDPRQPDHGQAGGARPGATGHRGVRVGAGRGRVRWGGSATRPPSEGGAPRGGWAGEASPGQVGAARRTGQSNPAVDRCSPTRSVSAGDSGICGSAVAAQSITPRSCSAALNAPSAAELPPIRAGSPAVTIPNSSHSRSCSARARRPVALPAGAVQPYVPRRVHVPEARHHAVRAHRQRRVGRHLGAGEHAEPREARRRPLAEDDAPEGALVPAGVLEARRGPPPRRARRTRSAPSLVWTETGMSYAKTGTGQPRATSRKWRAISAGWVRV